MAIDTANRRSSAINVSSPWRSRLPFPDGTIDAPDRLHTAFMYSGIAAGLLVYGAPHVVASQVYYPGVKASQVFHPGIKASQVVEQ